MLLCAGKSDADTFLALRETLFRDKPEQRLYRMVRDYYRKYGAFPSPTTINDTLGTAYRTPRGEPTHYLRQLRELNLRIDLSEALPGIAPLLKESPRGALAKLRELVASLSEDTESRDLRYASKTVERLERYRKRKLTDGVTYISTGDPLLDKLMFGYQETDLITVGGRSGVGKTWYLLNAVLLLDNWCTAVLSGEIDFKTTLDLERPILLVSNEMNEEELSDRMDCMKFGLSYQQFLSGSLTRTLERTYREGLEALETLGSNIVVVYNCDTLEALEAKIALYRPLITFIDGSYLLEPQMEEGFAKAVKITRALKGIARETRTPVFNTTQLRKKGRKGEVGAFDAQDEFYYGAVIQDSDFALRMFQDKDMVYHHITGLEFAKGRRIPPGTKILWECNTDAMSFNFSKFDDDETEFGEDKPPAW